MSVPRRFYLQRNRDITGASGTGRVADGVLWPDGTATLRWRGDRASTVNWDRIEDAEHIHGHGGHTIIVWLDDPLDAGRHVHTATTDGVHCDSGHCPPTTNLRALYEQALRATWNGTPMRMDDAIRTDVDAVMKVRDEEMEHLRTTLDRVQALAAELQTTAGGEDAADRIEHALRPPTT